MEAARQGRQCWNHEAAEGRFGSRTVEEDPSQARVCREEGSEVVGRDAGGNDAAVEAALSFAALQHIPQGEAGPGQFFEAGGIRKLWPGTDEDTKNFPEMIPGIRIIFSRAQRRIAWHAAENQGMSIARCGRRKAVNQGHGIHEGAGVGRPKSLEITFCAIEQRRCAVVYPLNQ